MQVSSSKKHSCRETYRAAGPFAAWLPIDSNAGPAGMSCWAGVLVLWPDLLYWLWGLICSGRSWGRSCGLQFTGKPEPLSRQEYGNHLIDDCGCGDSTSYNIAVLTESTGQGRDGDAGEDQGNTGMRHQGKAQIFLHSGRSA